MRTRPPETLLYKIVCLFFCSKMNFYFENFILLELTIEFIFNSNCKYLIGLPLYSPDQQNTCRSFKNSFLPLRSGYPHTVSVLHKHPYLSILPNYLALSSNEPIPFTTMAIESQTSPYRCCVKSPDSFSYIFRHPLQFKSAVLSIWLKSRTFSFQHTFMILVVFFLAK